jgi:hypothetical protein
MSLRQKYQEQFFKQDMSYRREKIKAIEEESAEVFSLFEDIIAEVKEQERKLSTIEENIEESVSTIKETSQEIAKVEQQQNTSLYKHFMGVVIGGGLGSIVVLYNPYVAIGTIIGGTIAGSLLAKLF